MADRCLRRGRARGVQTSWPRTRTWATRMLPETPDDGTIYTLRHVAAVKALMAANGDGSLPDLVHRVRLVEPHQQWFHAPWQLGVSEKVQGDYLVRTLQLVKASYPYVTNVFWYNDVNRAEPGVDMQNANYGLLRSDLTEKPAYLALQQHLAPTAASPVATAPLSRPLRRSPPLRPSRPFCRRRRFRLSRPLCRSRRFRLSRPPPVTTIPTSLSRRLRRSRPLRRSRRSPDSDSPLMVSASADRSWAVRTAWPHVGR